MLATYYEPPTIRKPLNSTNVIIRQIAQYKRKYKPEIDIINFPGPYVISKWKLFKASLNRRELHWATFANIMVYGGYVYNNFNQVWKFQVICNKNIYKILSSISRTSKQIVNLEVKNQSNETLNWNEHLSKMIR